MLEKHDLHLVVLELFAIWVAQTATVIVIKGISDCARGLNHGGGEYVRDFDAVFWEIVSLLISLDTIGDIQFDIIGGWKAPWMDRATVGSV